MEYTLGLEKRVQQGRDDHNPQHDVMKLRIDKGKYLYFVPRYDGKYEFCYNLDGITNLQKKNPSK